MKNPNLSSLELTFLQENFPSRGLEFCAESLSRPASFIKGCVRRNKIVLNKHARYLSRFQNFVPLENFLNPNPQTAYLLGFLWGDGYLLEKDWRIQCSIVSDDADMLRPIFLSSGRWKEYYRRRKHWKPVTAFHTNNKYLFEFLSGLGYTNKSELSCQQAVRYLPENLRSYFWRGYFDADGCFYFNESCCQCSLAGSFDTDWSGIEFLTRGIGVAFNIKQTIQKNGQRSSVARTTNRKGCLRLLSYLYQGEKFGLERKRLKAIALIEAKSEDRRVTRHTSPNPYRISFSTGRNTPAF